MLTSSSLDTSDVPEGYCRRMGRARIRDEALDPGQDLGEGKGMNSAQSQDVRGGSAPGLSGPKSWTGLGPSLMVTLRKEVVL